LNAIDVLFGRSLLILVEEVAGYQGGISGIGVVISL
jgi:hypothetical protein